MSNVGSLKRELGVFDATMMGVGAMVGTGVFVSIGIAAGVSDPSVVLAIALAAIAVDFPVRSTSQCASRDGRTGPPDLCNTLYSVPTRSVRSKTFGRRF